MTPELRFVAYVVGWMWLIDAQSPVPLWDCLPLAGFMVTYLAGWIELVFFRRYWLPGRRED